jgi:hypothetical protein
MGCKGKREKRYYPFRWGPGKATFLTSRSRLRLGVRAPAMPLIPRGQVARHAYHVLNRGNGGAMVFHAC